MSTARLDGQGVLVTRPADPEDELVQAITEAGGTAIRFPVIDIQPLGTKEISRQLSALPTPDLIVFVSRFAAKSGFQVCEPGTALVAAVGPSTAAALQHHGVAVDIVPDAGFDSEHLLDFPAFQNVRDKNVMIVRAGSGRELLADTLRDRGANVGYLQVYRRETSEPGRQALAELEIAFAEDRVQFVTAMSVDSLQKLLRLLPPSCLPGFKRALLVAPSRRVIQTATERIPDLATALAPGPLANQVVATLIAHRHGGHNG